MATQEMQVFSQWVLDNGRYVMQAVLDYPSGEWTDNSEMTDAEIQDGVPMICRAFVDDSTADAIQADSKYLAIWREVKDRISDINLDKLMTVNAIDKLATFLRNTFDMTNQEIAAEFNKTPLELQAFLLTRTRAEVVEILKNQWRRLA